MSAIHALLQENALLREALREALSEVAWNEFHTAIVTKDGIWWARGMSDAECLAHWADVDPREGCPAADLQARMPEIVEKRIRDALSLRPSPVRSAHFVGSSGEEWDGRDIRRRGLKIVAISNQLQTEADALTLEASELRSSAHAKERRAQALRDRMYALNREMRAASPSPVVRRRDRD